MGEETIVGVGRLVEWLDRAVRRPSLEQITVGVRDALQDSIRNSALRLPVRFEGCRGDSYARRLLHRDPTQVYTVVAMTWGPGQHTGLHDHAGIWCVECVLKGELDVTQYDLEERENGRYRFTSKASIRARVGDAGCLIPPFEYHVLSNPRRDQSSITVHVYGGEMDHCNIYLPQESGWWERQSKRLTYDD